MTGPNATRDPDSVLAAWLDEGPTDLPDATRRAILTALPTTPQARRGPVAAWRFQAMSPLARGAAAVLIAAVALGGFYLLAGRSGPSAGGPSPAPSVDTSGWTTYTSTLYGLTFGVPAGWTVSPGKLYPLGPANIADTAQLPGSSLQFWAKSEPAPIVHQTDWWLDYFIAVFLACDSGVQAHISTIQIDGYPAYLLDASTTCDRGQAIAVVGGRLYTLTVVPADVARPGASPRIDHATFLAWLGTVRFDPASARDSPIPVTSP